MARIAALLVALLGFGIAPAHARVTAVIPADADGPNDAFLTNEILYATGVNNALEGTSQLCVVPSGHPGEGSCPEDGRWGRPNAVVFQGTFPPQPIVAPLLPEGTWRILADNGDGENDPPDVVSEPFTVSPCPPGDDCSTALAEAQMNEWKQAAAEARTGMAVACVGTSVFTGAGAKVVGSALLGNGYRGTLMAEIKGEGVGLAFGPRESQSAALSLLRGLSCGAFVMYDDIVADPPDPNYKDLVEPAPSSVDLRLGADGRVIAAAQALEDIAVQGKAHRVGIERYQGAIQAGDEGWAAAHAIRVGEQALETQSQMRRLGRRLDAAATAISDLDVTAATAEDLATARTIRERVRISGFTAEETAELRAEGLTEAEIGQMRAQLGAPLPDDVTPVAPDTALRLAADHVDRATCIDESDLCGFDTMGRFASAVGANGAIPPTVSVTPLEIRESDIGVNHGRVRIELSHPSALHMAGPLEIAHQTTAEDEVTVSSGSWWIPPGWTQTYNSITIANDIQDEPTETASLTATTGDQATSSPPATITVLDDDGAGDPQTRPRSQRGLVAVVGPKDGSTSIFLSEPDGSELIELAPTGGLMFAGWSPNGRSLILQNNPPTLTALNQQGTAAWRLPVSHQGKAVGDPIPLFPAFPITYNPAFSHDSRRLVASQYIDGLWKLVVMPLDAEGAVSGPVRVTGDDPPMEGWWAVNGATFNADRSRIVFTGCKPGATECGIYIVPVDDAGAATGAPAPFILDEGGLPHMVPSWSPDGRFIAYQGHQGDVPGLALRRVDASGQPIGPERWITSNVAYTGLPAAWAPDSRAIAVSTAQSPLLPTGANDATVVVELNADGVPVGTERHLALTEWSASGAAWGTLPPDPDPPPGPDPSPDPTPGPDPDPVPTASPKASPTPSVAPTPAPAPSTTAAPPPPSHVAAVPPAALPSNRRCVSRRKFTIRLRESRADPLVRAEVYLGRERVKVVTGARLTAPIDLRGLPKGRVTVKVNGITRAGKRVTSERTYRTCAPKRRR